MIPKIIHYCWFGKSAMPKSQRDCIKRWKKLMPDYEFMLWDEKTFDVDFCAFSSAAYKKGKYAYVADVARLYALRKFGGIYLDTDVDVFARYDDFLKYDFFTGIEMYPEFYSDNIAEKYLNEDFSPIDPNKDVPKCEILTSTIGAAPGCKVISEVLDYFIKISLTQEMIDNFRDFYNYDRMFARYLVKYGFKYVDKTQCLEDNMIVMGTGTFGYMWSVTPKYTVSFHHNSMTWNSDAWDKHTKKEYFFDRLGLLPLYKTFKRLKKTIRSK